jgi:hypothetical protein
MWAYGGRLVLVLLGLVLASCKHHAEADVRRPRAAPLKPAVSAHGKPLPKHRALQGDTFRYRFAIYLPATPKLDLNRELARVEFRAENLSAEEKQQLLRSRFVALFDVIGPGSRALADYRRALVLGQTLATKLGGILWDEETRHAYPLKGWQKPNRLLAG